MLDASGRVDFLWVGENVVVAGQVGGGHVSRMVKRAWRRWWSTSARGQLHRQDQQASETS